MADDNVQAVHMVPARTAGWMPRADLHREGVKVWEEPCGWLYEFSDLGGYEPLVLRPVRK